MDKVGTGEIRLSQFGSGFMKLGHVTSDWIRLGQEGSNRVGLFGCETLYVAIYLRGLGGVVGLTLPMARADRSSRPVYYLPWSDLGQVVNLSLSVA